MNSIDTPPVAIKFDSANVARLAARAFGLGILRSVPTHRGPDPRDVAYHDGYSLTLEAQVPVDPPADLSPDQAGAWEVGASEAMAVWADRWAEMEHSAYYGHAGELPVD